ncbi:hypothetical protein DY000_02007998 [Brassica cretica]|uniref:Remorin C-terminal domain-containing protein n=1 Tax=Brassica cretica TaxID=69181 RepID=A0ABQ7C5M5_BRACR|nr:hypothetical protein DY000_02007998 [Brassica cretica]
MIPTTNLIHWPGFKMPRMLKPSSVKHDVFLERLRLWRWEVVPTSLFLERAFPAIVGAIFAMSKGQISFANIDESVYNKVEPQDKGKHLASCTSMTGDLLHIVVPHRDTCDKINVKEVMDRWNKAQDRTIEKLKDKCKALSKTVKKQAKTSAKFMKKVANVLTRGGIAGCSSADFAFANTSVPQPPPQPADLGFSLTARQLQRKWRNPPIEPSTSGNKSLSLASSDNEVEIDEVQSQPWFGGYSSAPVVETQSLKPTTTLSELNELNASCSWSLVY